jgi:hypothetical protein
MVISATGGTGVVASAPTREIVAGRNTRCGRFSTTQPMRPAAGEANAAGLAVLVLRTNRAA